jgi:error-prone DNA polymerase
MPKYVEFAVTSNFSFLWGGSHPEELIAQAARLALLGMGLCDRNSVAGVVRAHLAKRENELDVRYHPGARLIFCDGTPDILAYPRDRAGWGKLCRLLTRGNLRAQKGDCILYLEDLLEHADGLELLVMARTSRETAAVEYGKGSPQSPPSPRRGEGWGEGDRTVDNFLKHRDPLTRRPTVADLSPTGRGDRSKPFAPNTNGRAAEPLTLLHRLREAVPKRVRLAAAMLYAGTDRARLARRAAIARDAGVPLIAVNDVLYHAPERRRLADVLTCIREHVTLEAAGRRLAANSERYLKPPAEMARMFRDHAQAIEETSRLSDRLTFSLDELSYQYPDETREGFSSPQDALAHLSLEGAAQRYPAGIPEKVRAALAHELELIASLDYAPYFLTVHDIVRFARSRGILCQGRGSAANSAVCFCLGITEVDPERTDLLFERFISAERREPPDIDVDFEHERREEVIQHIYARYGRERAGLAATVISYRGRSAVREVGKAFGFSEDTVGALASTIWGFGGEGFDADLSRAGLDAQSPAVRKMLKSVASLLGFPRHLSQHVGGFVITRDRLDEVVPVGNAAMEDRTVVEWDKDDLDALGILKIDVLGLGMLTCLRKALTLIERHYADKLTLAQIPAEDPAVYRMLQRADSIGVFQVESRAQMSMLPRLKPRNFYDLVIEVAIVRPGPIQGDMVHPYLRRRQGTEPVTFPSKELETVLGKTLGVPLFQEQAMRIAIVAAGFTASEADKLRRAMATFRRVGTIGTFQRKMIEGMVARNYDRDFAERCFHQIEGFGEYGFPESHAASFALLVYASAFIKCRYPDAFAAALLNAQPMGFYAPAQIVRDAREHGVEVRPVDINHSDYEASLEPGPRAAEHLHEMHRDMAGDVRARYAVRLGLKEVKGLAEEAAKTIVARRGAGYVSLRDLWLRTALSQKTIARLADADAFGSLKLSRRKALWGARALGRAGDQDDLPLFGGFSDSPLPPPPGVEQSDLAPSEPQSTPSPRRGEGWGEGDRAFVEIKTIVTPSPGGLWPPTSPQRGEVETGSAESNSEFREPEVTLPPMPLGEEVVNDYRYLKLSLRAHPASFLREDLSRRGILRNEALRQTASGKCVCVSGLVTVRQRPGSANGVIFLSIEDETALANIIVWPKVFERFRPVVLGARYVAATGRMQEESGVIHVVADQLEDLTFLLARLAEAGTEIEGLARCDHVKHPHQDPRDKPPRSVPRPRFEIDSKTTPDLAGDLDVPARASRHVVAKRRPP